MMIYFLQCTVSAVSHRLSLKVFRLGSSVVDSWNPVLSGTRTRTRTGTRGWVRAGTHPPRTGRRPGLSRLRPPPPPCSLLRRTSSCSGSKAPVCSSRSWSGPGSSPPPRPPVRPSCSRQHRRLNEARRRRLGVTPRSHTFTFVSARSDGET